MASHSLHAPGVGDVCQGNMIMFQRHIPHGATCPPPGFLAAAREQKGASSLWSEPPTVPATSTSGLAADPGPKVHGMMTHRYEMVDLMLKGPQAPIL